jgi:hypothetical protein
VSGRSYPDSEGGSGPEEEDEAITPVLFGERPGSFLAQICLLVLCSATTPSTPVSPSQYS